MTELHWSERRALESMIENTKLANEKERPTQEAIAKSKTPLAVMNAIVALIEHQRYRYAKAALEDRSKYPQRIEGCAQAFNALLQHDLYEIRKLMACK